MRVLLGGATGFIGGALRASLEADGHEVLPLGRPSSEGALATVDTATRTVDLAGIGGSLAGVDVVYALFGEPLTPTRWSPARTERIRSSRITTTDLLARTIASSEGAPPAFVVGSAVGFYGERGEEILDETSPAGRGFLPEVCRAWEAASSPAREAGARVVHVRSGIVLGPGGGALALQARLFRLGLGGALGSGRQWFPWVSLADEVGALRFAAERDDLSGPLNAVSPNPVRNRAFTASLARSVGRPARLRVPKAALVLAAGRRTTSEFLIVSQHVRPRRLEEAGYQFVLPELDEALRQALAKR